VWRNSPKTRAARAASSWRWLPAGFVCLCLVFIGFARPPAAAGSTPDADQLLRKADGLRVVNYNQFVTLVQSLQHGRRELTSEQSEYLRYLEGWKAAYEADNDTAIALLDALTDSAKDVTLRLRAGVTAVNVLQLSKRYEEAFIRLTRILAVLPEVSDRDARQQALLVAGQLYSEVGQIELALDYGQTVIDEDWDGRGLCRGGRIKVWALYEGGRLKSVGPQLQNAIDACVKKDEVVNANAVQMVAAKVYIDQRQYDQAIKLLQTHYNQVKTTRNPHMIARCEALLADAYRRKGLVALARLYASNVTTSPVKEFGDALVTAYQVLYEIAKEQGDFKAALAYHELYAAADKAYLDDLSARHLAYQKVSHENLANKLQVDALNKQNHVLQLERELSGKAVETSRLYIVLLTMTVLFIGLWAYRTKRLQLHFQNLARLDGLTGICNRPHFITQAEKALEASRRGGEQLCIVLCDLDHFKQINDRYGHATGDFVLKRTVSACNIHLSKSDIFGRFGGEEFAFLLPACGVEDARQRAEQLRLAIAGITAYQTGNAKATVSASFGIAGTNASGHELGQLLAHADSALYEAKRMGRNRVVVYSHTPSTGEVPALAIVSTTGEFVQVTGRSLGGN
jgi:diguanylate cyclase (GGDEF)-like protein